MFILSTYSEFIFIFSWFRYDTYGIIFEYFCVTITYANLQLSVIICKYIFPKKKYNETQSLKG